MAFAGHLPLDLPGGPGAGEALRAGPGATWLQAWIAILLTWLTVGVGVVRLDVSKWLPNLGAVVKAAIFLGLGVLGLRLSRVRPALRQRLPPRRPRAALERLPGLPARAPLQRDGLRAHERGGGRDEGPAAGRAPGDAPHRPRDRRRLHAGGPGDPARGAARQAEPRHRHVGRARGAGSAVGRRGGHPRFRFSASGSSTRAWRTSSRGAWG